MAGFAFAPSGSAYQAKPRRDRRGFGFAGMPGHPAARALSPKSPGKPSQSNGRADVVRWFSRVHALCEGPGRAVQGPDRSCHPRPFPS